jgi:hypothetical protein
MPLNALRIDVETLGLGLGVWARVGARVGVEWPIAIIFKGVVNPWTFSWWGKKRPPPPASRVWTSSILFDGNLLQYT